MSAPAADLHAVAPATGERLGSVRQSSPDHVRQALGAARDAQWAWSRRGAVQRATLLATTAAVLGRDREAIARLAAAEVGKPIEEARTEVGRAAHIFAYYGGIGQEVGGHLRASAEPGVSIVARAVPVGVASVISPWNFPVAIPAWKIAPALAAGCTVVWKPAPEAALTAQRLADALEQAGIGPAVLTVVQGGGDVGAALAHGDVDALSFTGSTPVGRRLAQDLGAGGRPRVRLELGGVNVAHVLADADLDAAAASIAAAAFGYAGQKCTATQVVAVDERRLEPFVAAGVRLHADAALAGAPAGWRGEAPGGDAYVAPTFAVVSRTHAVA